MQAPLPTIDERQRRHELLALSIIDTLPEERFDPLTRVAKAYFDVPITRTSLIDTGCQWFKSRVGLEATELPRKLSFCGHAIHSTLVFEVPDATLNARSRRQITAQTNPIRGRRRASRSAHKATDGSDKCGAR